MKHLARGIIKEIEENNPSTLSAIDIEIPDYTIIENHTEAKETMKAYLETLMNEVQDALGFSLQKNENVEQLISKAKKIINGPKFMQQKGIRSLIDEDARVGRKSRKQNFYGYKTELTMLTEEKLILTAKIKDGAYVDGTNLEEQLERIKNIGINISEFYGDKAYFRHKIIQELEDQGIDIYIPVSASSYKIDESLFAYNKDADTWTCAMGNETIKKKFKSDPQGYHKYVYYFEKEMCKKCTNRIDCLGKVKTAERILQVSVHTPKAYEYSQRQKEADFLEKYKARASIEGKNGEMKIKHRMAKTRGFGLCSVSTQVKLTALAVNLKRIAKLSSLNFVGFIHIVIKNRQIALRIQWSY